MKILLVDDVPIYLEMLREPLAGGGFSPIVATSAAEARAALARHRPRLAVVDLHMPDEPGDRLCRELKAATPPPAVVLMGIRGREEDRRRSEAAGCDDFLVKPIRPAAILAAAKRFLRVPERRPRVPLRVPVLFESGGRMRLARVTNLSSGGLFLATGEPLPRGTAVTLELRLPLDRSDTPLRLSARVSWTTDEVAAPPDIEGPREPGMGLAFERLGEASQAAVDRFVARMLAAGSLGATRVVATARVAP
ncbi:MAG TPA: response regulator [Thermodesulfobacteriota bacterium]